MKSILPSALLLASALTVLAAPATAVQPTSPSALLYLGHPELAHPATTAGRAIVSGPRLGPSDNVKAYIVNTGNSTVSVLDIASGKLSPTAIAVGSAPSAVVVDSKGRRAYVANSRSGNVSVIDCATSKVTATEAVGKYPAALALTADNTKLYVANQRDNSVSVIKTASNKVTATVKVGRQPDAIAVNPQSGAVYVANGRDDTVSVIGAGDKVTATITVGTSPAAIGVNLQGTTAYVANQLDNTISVIDLATNQVSTTITVGNYPSAITVSPSGTRVFVSNNTDNTVSVIDASNGKVLDTVSVGSSPQGMALSPTGKHLYVSNSDDNTLSVIDTGTDQVTATLADKQSAPVGVAMLTGAVTYAYIADFSSWIYVVDTTDNTQVDTIQLGGTSALAVNPQGTRLYAAGATMSDGNLLSVIDPASDKIVAKVKIGGSWGGRRGLGLSPDGRYVYVTNIDDHTLSVIDAASNKVVHTFTTDPAPVAVAASRSHIYVANLGQSMCMKPNGSSLQVLDAKTGKAMHSVTLSQCPYDIKLSPDGSRAYVSESDNRVAVIDTATGRLAHQIGTEGGNTPTSMALSQDGNTLYVAITEPIHIGYSIVDEIDTTSLSVTHQIKAGLWPQGIALTPTGSQLLITNTLGYAPPHQPEFDIVNVDTGSRNWTSSYEVGSTPVAATFATVYPSP